MTRSDGPSLIVAAIFSCVVALSLATAGPIHAQTSRREPPELDQGSDDGSWLDEKETPTPESVEKAEAASENDAAHAWYLLGRSHHNAGDYRAAITAWKRAEGLGFALPITRYNIAAAHARLGEVELAFNWLHGALDAGFAEVDLLIVDDDLATLRDDGRFARAVLRAYENAEACPDAEDQKRLEEWTVDPAMLERSGFQFATLAPPASPCVRETAARKRPPAEPGFAVPVSALE